MALIFTCNPAGDDFLYDPRTNGSKPFIFQDEQAAIAYARAEQTIMFTDVPEEHRWHVEIVSWKTDDPLNCTDPQDGNTVAIVEADGTLSRPNVLDACTKAAIRDAMGLRNQQTGGLREDTLRGHLAGGGYPPNAIDMTVAELRRYQHVS